MSKFFTTFFVAAFLLSPWVVSAQAFTNVYLNTASTTPYTGSNLIYDAELFDIYNAYDTSTGIYTAPISGYYQVNLGLRCIIDDPTTGSSGLQLINITQGSITVLNAQGSGVRYDLRQFVRGSNLVYFDVGDQIRVHFTEAGTGCSKIDAGQGETFMSLYNINTTHNTLELASTSILVVDNPASNIFQGMILFFTAFLFIVWFFKRVAV